MDKAEKPAPKKTYSPPVLTVYGTVRDLTKTVAGSGAQDGGSVITAKYHTLPI